MSGTESTHVLCKKCGINIDNESDLPYYIQGVGPVCTKHFIEELEKSRQQRIKDHPCPFKMKWAKMKTPDSGKEPPTLDWNDLIYCCRIMRGGGLDIKTGKMIETNECIGEENCPIYNGGIEKCNGK